MKNRIICFIVYFLFVCRILPQVNNRPVPENLFPYYFDVQQPINGYLLTTPFKFGIGPLHPLYKSPCPTILDSNGYVYWFLDNNANSNIDLKYHPEDSLFTFTQLIFSTAYFYILDINMNAVGVFTHTGDVDGDSHDIQVLSNGHVIIGTLKDSIMDLSSFTFNGIPGLSSTNVNACVLQEFDNNLNLVFQWNSLDHIHPSEFVDGFYPYNTSNFDYCHFNAVEEDDDGNLLISFRHLDAVYKINHSTGDVMWIMGGESNQFTFLNDNGFSGQHDIRKLPNGNYSLFDNSNTSPPPKISRGVEYSIDTTAMTVLKTWEYIHTPGFFSSAMGNHVTTLNEDHLIGYGLTFRPNPSAVITNDLGNEFGELIFSDSVVSYRVNWQEIPFQATRPQISCTNIGGGIILTGPSGYSNYLWNTGDTSQSILVTATGDYQLYVNFGIGMMGSEPVIINDIVNNCTTGIESVNEMNHFNEEIFYDLMGRVVKFPTPGNIYLVRLKNGKKSIRYITP